VTTKDYALTHQGFGDVVCQIHLTADKHLHSKEHSKNILKNSRTKL
jgi:hypothetical protein